MRNRVRLVVVALVLALGSVASASAFGPDINPIGAAATAR